MDGDHFSPSGFGVGAAATLGAVVGTTMLQIGANVADVLAGAREEDAWERVRAGMQKLIDDNEKLRVVIREREQAFEAIMTSFSAVTKLAQRQAEQIERLKQLPHERYAFDANSMPINLDA